MDLAVTGRELDNLYCGYASALERDSVYREGLQLAGRPCEAFDDEPRTAPR